MLLPADSNIPSESTIEHLSNHYILMLLNSKRAWIVTPTRNEERKLGYDAAMRNTKAAVIQYKRIARINVDGSVSITINAQQHRNLVQLFQQVNAPYAFFAFSDYQSYKQLDGDYRSTGSPEFFRHTLFVDIHAFPVGCTTLRLFTNGDLQAHRHQQIYSSPMSYWRGPEFVAEFSGCRIGNLAAAIAEIAESAEIAVEDAYTRASVLLWELSSRDAI